MNELSPPQKKRWRFHLSTTLVVVLMVGAIMRFAVPYWRLHFLGVTPELNRIEHADPEADARDAIAIDDLRFVAVFGVGAIVPGVDENLQAAYKWKGIRGTSDCIVSKEQERLQGIAYDYAEKYNRVILREISRRTDTVNAQRAVAVPPTP